MVPWVCIISESDKVSQVKYQIFALGKEEKKVFCCCFKCEVSLREGKMVIEYGSY